MSFDLDQISRETLDVAKAVTSGIDSTTGIAGIDLSGLVSLIPVNTPARNKFARVSGTGSTTAQWKALLNINGQQSDVAIGFDYAGGLVDFDEQDVSAPYVPFAKAVRITQDAMDIAKDYADVKAIGVLQALLQLQIGEDIHIINSQRWALPTPSAPTLTASASGGTIGASVVVNMKVAARSGWNYYYGGSTIGSSVGTVTVSAGTTNKVTAAVTAVQGAVAYDWFAATGAGTYYYVGTTTTNTTVLTAMPSANETSSSLPLLSSTLPTAVPTTNTSNSTNNYNGVLASTLGDYSSGGSIVAPGAGTASGATWNSLDGAALTMSGGGIVELDALLLDIWNAVQLSPDALMMSATEAQTVSNLVLNSSSATTFLQPIAGERTNLAAGGYVGAYVNRAGGGTPIPIEVHPHLAPGTIIARTDTVPFPGANIGNVFSVRTLRDYTQFDYAANRASGSGGGPRFDSEVRLMSTVVNKAPVTCGVLSNIG